MQVRDWVCRLRKTLGRVVKHGVENPCLFGLPINIEFMHPPLATPPLIFIPLPPLPRLKLILEFLRLVGY
jgi:hypothetical protein